MTRLILLFLLVPGVVLAEDAPVASSTPAAPPGELVHEIVALVNDKVITLFDINQKLASMTKALGEDETTGAKLKEKQQLVLDGLIDEILLVQVADELDITVSDAEVDEQLNAMLSQSGASVEKIAAELKKVGYGSLAAYKAWLKKELVKSKVVAIKVRSKIKVTDKEVDDIIAKDYDGGTTQTKMWASHIMIKLDPLAAETDYQTVYDKLYGIKEDIIAGKITFADAAKQYSDDVSAKNGGDIGEFTKGTLDEQFEAAAFDLEVGELSSIIKTQFGLHLIKCTKKEKVTLDEDSIEKLKEQIKFELMDKKFAKAYELWIGDLRDKASIKLFLE